MRNDYYRYRRCSTLFIAVSAKSYFYYCFSAVEMPNLRAFIWIIIGIPACVVYRLRFEDCLMSTSIDDVLGGVLFHPLDP